MLSFQIGLQAIHRESIRQIDTHQLPASVDLKVKAIAKNLHSPTCPDQLRQKKSHSFSPLSFLWWASLVMGTSAQQARSFPPLVELSALTGDNGFVLNGAEAMDRSGWSVARAGDVNGDRLDDFLVAAPYANQSKIYLVFGRVGLGKKGSIELSSLNGTDGFALTAEELTNYNLLTAATAGDLNNDSISDLVIGAAYASPSNKKSAGKSYVVFGKAGLGSSGNFKLSNLNGTNGFVLNGDEPYDRSGGSVAAAGDVNGDGIGDLVIGAPMANPSGKTQAGKSYVVFGGLRVGANGSVELASLNGTYGFILNGGAIGEHCGNAVAAAGDVNDDGIADLIIGADNASPGGKQLAGKTYVVFGNTSLGSKSSFELSSLNGTNGFVVNSMIVGDNSGICVASAGDLNGDRVSDLVIGATGYGVAGAAFVGRSYVIFGGKGIGSMGNFELSSLNGSNGFVLYGEEVDDGNSNSVASAGDINDDGIDDLVIGAYRGRVKTAAINILFYCGKSYVIFGKVGLGGNGSFELSSIDGEKGFILNGNQTGENAGYSVSRAGDVNGDGIADLVIGAPFAIQADKNSVGKSYVVFGRKPTNATVLTTTMIKDKPITSAPLISMISQSVITVLSPTSSSRKVTSTPPLDGSTFHLSLPLIIGISVAVAAVACSIFGSILYYIKRNRNSKNSSEARTKLQAEGAFPAGYTSIEAIQQGMASVRDENQDDSLKDAKSRRHYSDFSKEPPFNNGDQYNKVSLTQLNAEFDVGMNPQISSKQQGVGTAKPKSHYSNPNDVVHSNDIDQYDQVRLTQLNREVTKDEIARQTSREGVVMK